MVEQFKVPSLDGLTALANRDGVDIKPTLLRVMTDLYVQKPEHTPDEEAHYVELALRLIDQVDEATRTIVVNRLANYAGAPAVLLQHLELDRLQHVEAEPAPTPEPEALTTEKPEAPTLDEPEALTLEEPEALTLEESDSSETSEPEATAPLLPTQAATLGELGKLFLTADGEERRMILMHLDYADLPPAAPLAPQVAQDATRRLEMAALSHNSEGFVQEIEKTLHIDRALARRLIDDESGEPILVMAHALAMPPDMLQRILLCLNPSISHSVLRVYELSTLYEEMEPQSASRLIAIWQAAQRPAEQRQVYQPQHYDDGKDRPALPARPAIRWEEHLSRRAEG